MNTYIGQYATGIICQKCGRATARSIDAKGIKLLCFYCYRGLCVVAPDKESKKYREWIIQEYQLKPMFYGKEPNWKEIDKLKPIYESIEKKSVGVMTLPIEVISANNEDGYPDSCLDCWEE